MISTTNRRATLGGHATIAAAAAGIAGLVVTIAVAWAIFFGAATARVENGTLEPGYLDYGQRHRNDALVHLDSRGTDRLGDYGIRCVQTGWCVTFPGVPQPKAAGSD